MISCTYVQYLGITFFLFACRFTLRCINVQRESLTELLVLCSHYNVLQVWGGDWFHFGLELAFCIYFMLVPYTTTIKKKI